MHERYLKYYDRYRPLANLVFSWDALRTRSKVARQSLANRQRDYTALAGRPELLPLHHELNRRLLAARREWASYDYGEGYFYQGLGRIGITGLRDTDGRVAAMDLLTHVEGKQVLEIGCNTGFLSLRLGETAGQVFGFDLNPHLVGIAEATAVYLGITNAEFQATGFETFTANRRFDVVVSFANHSTYDRNTRLELDAYFRRCRELLRPGGLLLFESHPPEHEGDRLEPVCELIGRLFDIRHRSVPDYGTFLDRGRTFIIAEHTGA